MISCVRWVRLSATRKLYNNFSLPTCFLGFVQKHSGKCRKQLSETQVDVVGVRQVKTKKLCDWKTCSVFLTPHLWSVHIWSFSFYLMSNRQLSLSLPISVSVSHCMLPPNFLSQCCILHLSLSLSLGIFPLQSCGPFTSSFSSTKGGSCYINLLLHSSSSDYSTEHTLTHKYSNTNACT